MGVLTYTEMSVQDRQCRIDMLFSEALRKKIVWSVSTLGYMYNVTQRQFRKTHPDEHYAAAIFQCLRQFAKKYRQVATMACLDNKHKTKIGEPCSIPCHSRRTRFGKSRGFL